MFKIVFFLWRREEMSRDEFIQYYETVHAPLMISLVPQGIDFRRNYPSWGTSYGKDAMTVDRFDVMTEVTYPDREFFESVLAAAGDEANGELIAADEAAFEQRDRSKLFVVEEENLDEAAWHRPDVGIAFKLLRFQLELKGISEADTGADGFPEVDELTAKVIKTAKSHRRNHAVLDDPLTFMGGHHNREGGMPLWHRFDFFDEFWFEDEASAVEAGQMLRDGGDNIFAVMPVSERVST